MQISSVNYNTPNFQARIKIQKNNVISKLLKASNSDKVESANASIMASGSAMSTTGVASGLEQSLHYPNSIFAHEVYDSVLSSSGGENGIVGKSIVSLEEYMHQGPTANRLIADRASDGTGSCAFTTMLPAATESETLASAMLKSYRAEKNAAKKIPD